MFNMCVQVEEDDAPLSQVFRLSSPLPVHADDVEGKHEDRCTGSPRPHIEELLRRLEKRVAAVETSLGSSMVGISNILEFMQNMKRHFAKEDGLRSGHDVSGSPLGGVQPGTTTPPQGKLRAKTENVAKGVAGIGSHSSSIKQSQPHTEVARGASFGNPVVVLNDDESSKSAEIHKVGDRVFTAQDGPAKRVHCNPRIRRSPFKGRLPLSPPTASKEKHAMGHTGGPSTRADNYKDPPGYEGATDFGPTSNSEIKLPVLRPRNNSVCTWNDVWYTAHAYFNPHVLPHIYSLIQTNRQVVLRRIL